MAEAQSRPGIIYIAVNRVNQKAYVGQTVSAFRVRAINHRSVSTMGRDTTPFHRAIRKYGMDAFDFAVLESCDRHHTTMDAAEQKWIRAVGCMVPHGYNRTTGGQGAPGARHSEETRQKIRVSKIGDRNPMKNPETAKKHGDSITGPKHHLYGKFGADHPQFGKRHKLSSDQVAAMKVRFNAPDVVAARSKRVMGELNPSKRADVKAKISASLAKRWSEPGSQAEQSKRAADSWKDPQRLVKHLKGLAAMWARRRAAGPIVGNNRGKVLTAEAKSLVSERTRAAMNRPEVRAKMIGRVVSPEGRKRMSESKLGRRWTDAQKLARRESLARKQENNAVHI